MSELAEITEAAEDLILSYAEHTATPVGTYLAEEEADTPWLRMDAMAFLMPRVPGAEDYDNAHGDPDGHEQHDRAPVYAAIDDMLSEKWHELHSD